MLEEVVDSDCWSKYRDADGYYGEEISIPVKLSLINSLKMLEISLLNFSPSFLYSLESRG
jgi:hypothetical protein